MKLGMEYGQAVIVQTADVHCCKRCKEPTKNMLVAHLKILAPTGDTLFTATSETLFSICDKCLGALTTKQPQSDTEALSKQTHN